MRKTDLFFKRTIDICFSVLSILIIFPIWIIVPLLIKITSKGPVFFAQERPGKNGKIFKVYKFRTMKVGSEIMVKGVEVKNNDVRITSIGRLLRRTKIDELPQIYNIIKGEMSLVGPRPERISSLDDYDDNISKRLNVKPGITGLAQVSGNIHISLNQRYELDVYYSQNYSILLDIRIIIRTFFVILLGEEKFIDKPLVCIKGDFR